MLTEDLDHVIDRDALVALLQSIPFKCQLVCNPVGNLRIIDEQNRYAGYVEMGSEEVVIIPEKDRHS
jgi:hypothetical protein